MPIKKNKKKILLFFIVILFLIVLVFYLTSNKINLSPSDGEGLAGGGGGSNVPSDNDGCPDRFTTKSCDTDCTNCELPPPEECTPTDKCETKDLIYDNYCTKQKRRYCDCLFNPNFKTSTCTDKNSQGCCIVKDPLRCGLFCKDRGIEEVSMCDAKLIRVCGPIGDGKEQ